jgi:hypothetical protein
VNCASFFPVMTGREGSTFAIRRVTGTGVGTPSLLVDIEEEMKATTPVGTFGGGLLVKMLVKRVPSGLVPIDVMSTGAGAGAGTAAGGVADGRLGGMVRRLVNGTPAEFTPVDGTMIGVGIRGIAGGTAGAVVGGGIAADGMAGFVPAGTGTTGGGEGDVAGIIPTGTTTGAPALLVVEEKLTVPIAPGGTGEFDGTITAVTIGVPAGPGVEISITGATGVLLLLLLLEEIERGVGVMIGGFDNIVTGATMMLPEGPLVVESTTRGTADELDGLGVVTGGVAEELVTGTMTGGGELGDKVINVVKTSPFSPSVVEVVMIGVGVVMGMEGVVRGTTTGGEELGVIVIAVVKISPPSPSVVENDTKIEGIGEELLLEVMGGAGVDDSTILEGEGVEEMGGGVLGSGVDVILTTGGVVELESVNVGKGVEVFDTKMVGVMVTLEFGGVAGMIVTDAPSGALTVVLRHFGTDTPHLHSRIMPQV